MIIPVGLIARGLGGSDDAAEHALTVLRSRMMAAAFGELSAEKQAGRVELIEACTGPDACVVLLAGADWSATEIDHVRMTDLADADLLAERPRTPYRDADGLGLTGGTQGLLAVPPGRHRIRTTFGGRVVETDFVTLPREGLFLRWDGTAGRFVPFEASAEARLVEQIQSGQIALASYLEQVGTPRMQALLTTPAPLALAASEGAVHALVHAVVEGNTKVAANAVRSAIAPLVGIPVARFSRLTEIVGRHAFQLVEAGKVHEAWMLLQGALAILPDDPTVLMTLGHLQVRAGAKDAGRESLSKAMSREAGLEPAMRERVVALLAELA